MFEESRSFSPLARNASAAPAGKADHRQREVGQGRRSDAALRAIAWSDLTARLDAARDLRLALRHDAQRNIGDAAASFSDAAAQYFRALEADQHLVNLAALDENKDSSPIFSGDESTSDVGDNPAPLSPRDDARDEQ